MGGLYRSPPRLTNVDPATKGSTATLAIRFRASTRVLGPWANNPEPGSVGIRAVPLGLAQGPWPPIWGDTLARGIVEGGSPPLAPPNLHSCLFFW